MLAPTVRHLAFEREDGAPFAFVPGQFLQIHFHYADGKPTKRSYSVATIGDGKGPVQRIDPTDGIRDTLILLKHKLRGIETVVDIEPDLPQIEASGRDLNQVWTNLIDNAADAMDGSGKLTIEASRDGDAVVVRISDTGPGIDPEVMNRIFDPFFTTKAPGQGTGLGLHTVHTIVNRTGGEIKAESGPEGTSFIIRFPVT